MRFARNHLAITVAALLAPAAYPDSPWIYGIHFYGDPGQANVSTMTGGKGIWSLEVVVTNSDVWWGAAWQRDNRFTHMLNEGHSIIVRIEPQWGFAVPKEPQYPMSQYLPQVTAAANDLQNHVHIWQVGNEMNVSIEYDNEMLSPAAYVEAYRQIRAAIKQVNSPLGEQLALVGPVSPGPATGIRWKDGTDYLAEVCALLDPNEVDGFAIHAYGSPFQPAEVAREDFQAGYLAQLAVIDHYGFSAKPVFLTEFNRSSNPTDPSSEAESAQFLSGAFADLAAWNATPRAHPVSSMCWFVYNYDVGAWQSMSIEFFRTVNPPGPDNDLFDAFTFAANQNYATTYPPPDGYEDLMRDEAPPGDNAALNGWMVASSNSNTAQRMRDGGLQFQTQMWTSDGAAPLHTVTVDLRDPKTITGFRVHHASAGGLPSSFDTDAFQFETRTPTGEWSVDESVYNFSSMTERTYRVPRFNQYVRMLISDPGRDNFARVPEFEVYAIDSGDFDENGAIDLRDAAQMQQKTTGAGGLCDARECLWAHFDEDGDIDADDALGFFDVFQGPATN